MFTDITVIAIERFWLFASDIFMWFVVTAILQYTILSHLMGNNQQSIYEA